MSHEKQICFYLSGIVQGVGMRQHIKSQADSLGIKGFVRNLPDGRVQCVAQGAPEVLQELKEILANARVGRVKDIQEEELEEKAEYKDFTIKP